MLSAWDDIARSDHPKGWNERRADPKHPLDFFRGRDYSGRPMFMFRMTGHPGTDIRPPQIGGIDIGIEQIAGGDWQLRLLLHDRAHEDIFGALCMNLMEATREAPSRDEGSAVKVVLNRLKRWQELLKARWEKVLARSEIIGLVGELLFLRDVVMRHRTQFSATLSWRGPFSDEQDFLLGDWLIELKTQLTSADRKLNISSEDQLNTVSGYIMVCHQTLQTEAAESGEARSLNELVTELLSTFEADDINARDVFQSALLELGYANRPEYDDERWQLSERRFFEVGENFPRITPDMLTDGVRNVRYTVSLQACDPFEVSQATAQTRIFHATE